MKITERLLADHKAFRKLLDDIDQMVRLPPGERDAARLRRVAPLLRRMVDLHAAIEDGVFFPALASRPTDFPANNVAHLVEEHRAIHGYLAKLEAQVEARPMAPSWPQTFSLLAAGLKAHLKREEEDVFPKADLLLGKETLEALSHAAESRGEV